jgi:hypothetical protein
MSRAMPFTQASLRRAIAAVRELKQRANVGASRKLRQSIADYQVQRMQAVKATLEWLRDNETEVAALIAAKRGEAA